MPFRDRYLDHAGITEVLRGWAERWPDRARLRSIGTSREGREIWCLTVGVEPDRVRPAMLVDANQHASELCGSNVALAVAEELLALHADPEREVSGVPRAAHAALREGLLHVVPRVSPDGAEKVLRDHGFVRSVPRDARPTDVPRWVIEDLDGDGRCLAMRRRDPAGDHVESRAVPGLMVHRDLDDEPPFYQVYPEGRIAGFDGTIPAAGYLSDNYPDLNRNFPYDWRPDPEQYGAGPYPASEPESRALVELATANPSLFAWIDYHTFGGVFIRPLGAGPDTKLDAHDLALYRRLEVWAKELTGYPMVSGFEEFTYVPGTPLRGDMTEYAFHQRGCVTFVVELWDALERAGLPAAKRFVDRYVNLDRAELEEVARWAEQRLGSPVVQPWRAVAHPQLGLVEVGGWDPLFVLGNPPVGHLAELCRRHAAMALRVMALAPRLELAPLEVTALGDGVRRVATTVRNVGYLPTWVVEPGRAAPHTEPIVARVVGGEVLGPARVDVGQLAGWGRGRHGPLTGLFEQRSPGSTGSRDVAFVVRGAGPLVVEVGSCRTGWVRAAAPG